MEYPSNLNWVEHRGAFIPNIIPPKNWKTGLQKFYEKGGKEKMENEVEKFSSSLESVFGGKPELLLRWSEEDGLNGISLSYQQGMYFEEGHWIEHNLGTKASLIAFGILSNYYHELSRYIVNYKK